MSIYSRDEVVAQITWTIPDVEMALKQRGIKPTDENIAKLLSFRFTKTLEERSIEQGWEVIDTLISMTDFDKKEE